MHLHVAKIVSTGSSVQIYLIEQYMNRDFQIKYLTYLIENNVNSKIKDEDKTWNTFITIN